MVAEGERSGDDVVTSVTAIIVLGVGLVALFLDFAWFWMAWAVGFAVVVPLVAILRNATRSERAAGDPAAGSGSTTDRVRRSDRAADTGAASKNEALETLRERYARGELSDAEFEAKLDRLLATETLEDARRVVYEDGSDRAGQREPGRERSREEERWR